MSEILTKPYEISVWEDRLVQIPQTEPAEYKFEEVKLAVIGSNTMTGLNKVYDPVFNKKSNGERTLTFSLKYKYYDPYTEKEVINPFAGFLINERKVKLKYDEEWYEFIVKDHSESNEEYTWTYTCSDAFVLELSKQGYNITFDAELNNNQGTARELAQETLKDTDWQLGIVDVGKQLIAEPIYKAILVQSSDIKILDTDTNQYVTFENNLNIYLFYSYIANKNGKFVQFILRNEDSKAYVIDNKHVITATNFRIENELFYKEIEVEDNGISTLSRGFYDANNTLIISIFQSENKYQANRLGYGQLNTYDPVMERTVDRYVVNNGDLEVYKYTDYTYTTSNVVTNFIVNGENFNILEDGSLQGWNPYTDQSNEKKVNALQLVTRPEIKEGESLVDISQLSEVEGFLKIDFNDALVINNTNHQMYNTIFNDGIKSNRTFIQSISKGDQFIFRYRARVGNLNDDFVIEPNLCAVIAKYTSDEASRFGYYYKHINTEDIVVEFEDICVAKNDITVNYITGGQMNSTYVLTRDKTVKEEKVYYSKISENEYVEVDTPSEAQIRTYYEKIFSYIIDGVPQVPSTRYVYKEIIEVSGETQTKEWVWNNLTGNFEEKNNTNYLPYVCLTGTAVKSISNTDLTDPKKNYGIFLYLKEGTEAPETSKEIVKEFTNDLPASIIENIPAKDQTTITFQVTNANNQIVTNSFNSANAYRYEDSNFIITYNNTTNDIQIVVPEIESEEESIELPKIKKYEIEYQIIKPIYIQDIQLTRYVLDENEEVVLIGNVPTATSNSTDYFYLKPDKNVTADEIITYTDLQKLAETIGEHTTIEPLYNKDSEKNLSISVAQSNCFNILQTIAETFECWVELEVKHDPETGKILFDEESGKPEKYINLREYVGKENHAGFKYGINLNTIERTINSDEFVTKLIVDQAQSDYTDEGFVSISTAPSNPSQESYILDFSYYYGQGLLDSEVAEADKQKFIEDVRQINDDLSLKEERRRNLEAALTTVGSNRTIYLDLLDSAKDELNDALGEFESLTHKTYEEFCGESSKLIFEQTRTDMFPTLDTTLKSIICNLTRTPILGEEIKFTIGGVELIFNAGVAARKSVGTAYDVDYKIIGELHYFEVTNKIANSTVVRNSIIVKYLYEYSIDPTESETIIDLIGTIYVNSSTINNYSGLYTNVNQEYEKLRKELYGYKNYSIKIWVDIDNLTRKHLCIELNDYLEGFKFEVETDGEPGSTYTVTNTKKFFDLNYPQNAEVIKINFDLSELNNYTMPVEYYIVDDDTVARYKITCTETITGLVDEIEQVRENKNVILKEFNNKYSRFIQEGTWSSTEYIDAEKYYLDALQVSSTSAEPVVSYTIDVVEISQLEGHEWYNFDAGDKSYVEDTEFFGWELIDGILTPIKEEVIVSEVEWHLDEPDQNTITVQNYKTRFEDLFQRVSATVQTVQYNEATYAKISTLLDADGLLNPNVLIDSLNNLSGQRYTLTSNGSVVINDDQVIIQNLTNLNNRIELSSEGIQVTSNGGDTWSTAITGEGINAGLIYTGSLNTKQIIIGNKDNPSFRWDKSGISAFKTNSEWYFKTLDSEIDIDKKYYTYDSQTDTYSLVVDPQITELGNYYEKQPTYDLQTYVRFDQYGVYGVKKGQSFEAKSLDDVLDKAHFAVTWDGFFIKNSYEGGGRVEITSDNDFRVLNNGDNEKIKIGALEWMILTEDISVVQGKVYYQLINGNYQLVQNPIGNPNQLGYYEKKLEPQEGIAPSLYGIRMLNNAGEEVMKTGDDGNLTIVGTIEALGANFSKEVTVGKNDDTVSSWIVIDGVNSSIYNKYDDEAGRGSDWIIDKNGDAIFNNITARGAIRTAVFEYAEIQAVGGLFFFRPSSTIRNAEPGNNNDLIITVENSKLFSVGDWCKVSNYTSSTEPIDTLGSGGLSYVYEISSIDLNTGKITLSGAAAMIGESGPIASETELIGGALISLGKDKDDLHYDDGIHNYAIGINSSDNMVNLPRRAISLFETEIDDTEEPRISYNYRGILGTLPELSYETQTGVTKPQVAKLYHDYLANKQGIYTDNMYIGDADKYVAFYRDNQNNGYLKVKGTIEAEAGYISGSVQIGSNGPTVSELGYSVEIKSEINYTNNSAILTAIPYYQGSTTLPSLGTGQSYGYQWYKNSILISGENQNILNLSGSSALEATYSCTLLIEEN